MRNYRIFLSGLVLLGLVSCNDHFADPTTTAVARQEIQQNTSETSLPIMINDLPLSDRDSKETAKPGPI